MQDRFKRLLSEKNLTATHFAALIKVNASAISHILNGRSKPGFDLLDKIAQALPDVNMNWLITGKGSPYINKQTNVSPSIPSLSIDSNEQVFHTNRLQPLSSPLMSYQTNCPNIQIKKSNVLLSFMKMARSIAMNNTSHIPISQIDVKYKTTIYQR